MAVTRTFSIIKPDATRRNLTGAVNAVIEKAGLQKAQAGLMRKHLPAFVAFQASQEAAE